MCFAKGLRPSVQVKSSSTYNWLRCSGAVSDLDSVKKHNVARLESLREKQNIVEKEFKLLRDECLRLKSLIEEMVGPTENNLLKVLDDIKVVRRPTIKGITRKQKFDY